MLSLSTELANVFNKDVMTQIADHAAQSARIMLDDTSFIKMSDEERTALDAFQQTAFFMRRLIAMIE